MAAWASQPPQAAKKTPPNKAPAKTATAAKSAPSRSSASNKSSTSKSYSASRSSTAARKAPSKTTSSSLRKSSRRTAPVHTAAARPRQLQPTPERYHEIQDALVAKGYLRPDQATGNWDQNSIDALKRFQAEQKLDASGKITSMSLIALGLGPKHDSAPLPTPSPGGGQDRN